MVVMSSIVHAEISGVSGYRNFLNSVVAVIKCIPEITNALVGWCAADQRDAHGTNLIVIGLSARIWSNAGRNRRRRRPCSHREVTIGDRRKYPEADDLVCHEGSGAQRSHLLIQLRVVWIRGVHAVDDRRSKLDDPVGGVAERDGQ